ncbi:hypothetical protein [Micromonospora tulbaghiae]|uniref:hypothetical protein n=1 Tax=Micromonospora tulbaghiae TaxID=479978 RepID=UPI0033FC2921
MPRAMKVCSKPGCPQLVPAGTGRCAGHRSEANRARGGYATRGGGNAADWRRARAACLARDPLCRCTDERHGHGPVCTAAATVADHYPETKADLVARGVTDPDALHRLRGVCASCHGKHTAETTPGGWNVR